MNPLVLFIMLAVGNAGTEDDGTFFTLPMQVHSFGESPQLRRLKRPRGIRAVCASFFYRMKIRLLSWNSRI